MKESNAVPQHTTGDDNWDESRPVTGWILVNKKYDIYAQWVSKTF